MNQVVIKELHDQVVVGGLEFQSLYRSLGDLGQYSDYGDEHYDSSTYLLFHLSFSSGLETATRVSVGYIFKASRRQSKFIPNAFPFGGTDRRPSKIARRLM
jgi:hypothetical protein